MKAYRELSIDSKLCYRLSNSNSSSVVKRTPISPNYLKTHQNCPHLHICVFLSIEFSKLGSCHHSNMRSFHAMAPLLDGFIISAFYVASCILLKRVCGQQFP